MVASHFQVKNTNCVIVALLSVGGLLTLSHIFLNVFNVHKELNGECCGDQFDSSRCTNIKKTIYHTLV